MRHKIVIATGNQDKMREIREIFADLDAEILSMKEAGAEADPEETGTTFAENAMIKAEAVHALLPDAIVMADDSGLEVDHLHGEPGIYSARWLGRETSYDEKNAELIRRLEGVEGAERAARFRAAIACILPDGRHVLTEAAMEGQVAHAPAGKNGFGYDPVLYLPEYGKCSAELTEEQKNAISHRGKALRMMREKLKEELG
ncbi:MAG: RdgB/HAM1 family non-canonical purine NTP pyrophosphatase [Stomatobaculum sp.]|nr:RdgB/HAM1 family non-canonical purine NTP pyrophosphatase [Stomatobaculum sp.]